MLKCSWTPTLQVSLNALFLSHHSACWNKLVYFLVKLFANSAFHIFSACNNLLHFILFVLSDFGASLFHFQFHLPNHPLPAIGTCLLNSPAAYLCIYTRHVLLCLPIFSVRTILNLLLCVACPPSLSRCSYLTGLIHQESWLLFSIVTTTTTTTTTTTSPTRKETSYSDRRF